MKPTLPSRGRHRQSGSSPRSGAAALMIGGLVAGTVATAGAATLSKEPVDGTSALAADLSSTLTRDASTDDDAARAAQLMSLRSSSLDELRAQPAADRSQARSAPQDDDAVLTLLGESTFTGTTLEVEEPVETVQVEEVEEVVEEQPAETAQQAEPVEEVAEPEPAQTQEPAQQAQVTQESTTQTQSTQSAPAPVGGSVLGIAASYVGYPYVLYGTPPSSFDCSAYTWWVFQQAGISIPRSVAGQKGAVTPVSNPQPGDLIFYNDYHHVGIYAGNGMTYEALNPSSGVRYGPMISTNVWYGRIG